MAVNPGGQYVHGHNRRGIPRSPAALAKLRDTWAARRTTWAAAIAEGTRTPSARANYSKAHKGHVVTPETRRKIGEANKTAVRIDGDVLNSDGRSLAYVPNHPAADRYSRVRRARVVLEEKLGRQLTQDEIPHHINFDVADDHPDNLALMLRSEHTAFHHRLRRLRIEDHFKHWFSRSAREGITT